MSPQCQYINGRDTENRPLSKLNQDLPHQDDDGCSSRNAFSALILSPEMNAERSLEERVELELKIQDLRNEVGDRFISFEDLHRILPPDLSPAQLGFTQKIYNISSEQETLGEEEIIALHAVCSHLEDQSKSLQIVYDDVNWETIEEDLIRYMGLFGAVDRQKRGFISVSSLREILGTSLDRDLKGYHNCLWTRLTTELNLGLEMTVSKVKYLASIPYFLSLEREGRV
ncbi:uncharacterized protein LOC102357275 [Latimeria chalumnae]|uniref:uncharacterized protein LOC102357275 n=1 Tax=Latimeria chalumnae TaxID=7897 RepID=UPI00313D6FC4